MHGQRYSASRAVFTLYHCSASKKPAAADPLCVDGCSWSSNLRLHLASSASLSVGGTKGIASITATAGSLTHLDPMHVATSDFSYVMPAQVVFGWQAQLLLQGR